MDDRLKMYEELTTAPGIAGYEGPVRRLMHRYLARWADQIVTDNLGSIAGVKAGRSDGPRIMVAGHLDEVGWIVTQITDKGFLRFQTVGGWWGQVLLAQRVRILTRNGDLIGLIGSKPPHILSAEARKKPAEIKEMFIDIGAASEQEALAFGVRPGDPIVPHCDFTVMPNPRILMNKAWDNRAGCAAAVMVLEELHNAAHDNVVYAAATVQEEVGLRGAGTLAHVVQPDIGIALDVSVAGDVPGVKETEARARMGKGPVIILYDAELVPSPPLRHLVIDTAEELGIPYQFDALPGGGTDAGKIHLWGRGVPSIAIAFATRYIHTHAGLIDRTDIEQTAKLVAAVIRKLDGPTVAQIKDSHL